MLIFFSVLFNVTVDLTMSFKEFKWVLDENLNLAMNHIFKLSFPM